jgi:hypothetical protein
MNNRKGQIFDLIPLVVYAVIGIAVLFIFYILFNSLTGTGISVMEEFIQEGLYFVKGLDLLVPASLIAGMLLSIWLIAPLRQIDGAWVVVLLLGLIVLFIAVPFGNFAEEFITSETIAPLTPDMPFTTFTAQNIPLIVGVWVVLLVIFSANKSSGGAGFYG